MAKLLKRYWYSIVVFFSILGPGMITANVDNDSGGIYTYSQRAPSTDTCHCGAWFPSPYC